MKGRKDMVKNEDVDPKKKVEYSDGDARDIDNIEVKPEEKNSEIDSDVEMDKLNENLNSEDLLKKKESESRELLERIQRLAAEYDNFRKRTLKEKERIYADTLSEVVAKFLPVVDNLERAIKAAENEECQGLKDGVTLVYRQFIDVLDKLDVKPIEAVGAAFNPELHNAVMHTEDETQENNIVVEEFQKGYIYKDEIVIRHSMVKVVN